MPFQNSINHFGAPREGKIAQHDHKAPRLYVGLHNNIMSPAVANFNFGRESVEAGAIGKGGGLRQAESRVPRVSLDQPHPPISVHP